jgi:L-arabinose isomerase
MQTRLQDRVRRVDLRRRRAPHRLQLQVTTEMLEDFATIADIETVIINAGTTLPALKQDLRNNEVYYHLSGGFRA